MPSTSFPRSRLASLHELATRVIERRGEAVERETLARDLLAGFYEVCQRTGLDGVLVEIEERMPPIEITDALALADNPRVHAALVEKLGNKADYDPRGPRNAKPRQLAECLVASLGLSLVDNPDRTVTFDDTMRTAVTSALFAPLEAELAVPQIRDTMIAAARRACDERYISSFDKMSQHLDERGDRMLRQLKLPLDAVQAVQAVLAATKRALLARVAGAALDRARDVLARVDADAAARIDQPLTHRLTVRDVALERASEPRTALTPAAVAHSLLESLAELVPLTFSAREQPSRTYSPSITFAVGELVEHPKFGRGTVTAIATQRMDVEFADGNVTLVHARGK